MILRILQLLILISWFTTTFYLVRRSYFPDEERYPEAPIDYVSDLFFSRVSQSELLISHDGRPISHLTVTPKSADYVPPILEERREQLREINYIGLVREEVNPQFGAVDWHGAVYVNPEFEPEALRMTLRSPRMGLNGELLLVLNPPHIRFRLGQGDMTILNSQDPEGTMNLLRSAGAMAPGMEENLAMLEDFDRDQLHQMIATLDPTVMCRHGQFQILGDRYEGYIVKISLFEGAAIRLYLSEMGELLMMDGIPNVEVLGEAFISQDTLTQDSGE